MNSKEKDEQIKKEIKVFETKMATLGAEHFIVAGFQDNDDDYYTLISNSLDGDISPLQYSVLVDVLSEINKSLKNCTLIRFIEIAKKGGLI